MCLDKVLPKSDNLNTSTYYLTNNIMQQQPSNLKELEFIINKDNPTIVEYYTNNSKDNNKICMLNYYPYYWNSYENESDTMELVQRRKKLFNKEEFWKEFARKVDDLNRSPPLMQLSNYCTKTSTNHCNCSYTMSDHNNYEPKLPLSNNYCPLFRLSSASNDTQCLKAKQQQHGNIEEQHHYSNESKTSPISQQNLSCVLSQQYEPQHNQKPIKKKRKKKKKKKLITAARNGRRERGGIEQHYHYRESLAVSPTSLPSTSSASHHHHQIYRPSPIAACFNQLNSNTAAEHMFHHCLASTDSYSSSIQPIFLPSFQQQQHQSFSDSQYNSDQSQHNYCLNRQSMPNQLNTSKNSEFNAGDANRCLYCDLYFE